MMKNKYTLGFALLFLLPVLGGAQEIEVPQTNHPLITKRTATWCPKCGGYGWTLFRDLLADNQSEALVIAAHFGSSTLANDVSNELTTALGGFGQPIFFLNTENLGVTSGNIATVRQDAAAAVDIINEMPPVAQTGLLAQATEDSLIVQTQTEFFESFNAASINLSVYLIEPTVVGNQSGQGAMAEHKNVLRYAMSGTAFGETIAEGGAAAGDVVARRYSISVADLEAQEINTEALGNNSLIVAAVLWLGNAEGFEVLNTNQVTESMLSSASGLAARSKLEVFPVPATSSTTLKVTLEQALTEVTLSLINAQGKPIRVLHRGALGEGVHAFSVARQELPAGLYWIQLSNCSQSVSRPILFR